MSTTSSYAQIIAFCSIANFINSADRVIMPIAIIPMSSKFGWSLHQKGWILSSFHAGFFTSQIIGAGAAPKFGAKFTLAIAVFVWSLATFITPIIAHNIPFLVFIRILMGIGEGFGLPAIFHIYSDTLLPGERSRAFGYLIAFGSIGQCSATLILPHVSWPNMFYGLGAFGLIWVMLWLIYYKERRSCYSSLNTNLSTQQQIYDDEESQQPLTKAALLLSSENNSDSVSLYLGNGREREDLEGYNGPSLLLPQPSGEGVGYCCCSVGGPSTPAWLRNNNNKLIKLFILPCLKWWVVYFDFWALWAIYIAHFAMNWSNYIVLNWLPTYLTSVLHASPDHISMTAVPYAVNSLVGVLAGHWADNLLTYRGKSILYIRRLMTFIGLVVPAICLIFFAAVKNLYLAILVISILMAASACNSCGHLSNHSDLAPRKAGITFAISNTIAALPGMICGPLTADLVHKSQGRWFPVFWIAGLINILAAVIYCGHSSATQIIP